MLNKYAHIQCDEFALVLDIRWVEEVVKLPADAGVESDIVWRGGKVPYLNLNRILAGSRSENSRHCIITRDGDNYLALGVGQVDNIQTIGDNDFDDLPSLDFPFNEYFDKAYMRHQGKKCIYRLRNLAKGWQAKAG